MGIVGDGGIERFGAQMAARTPEADRERAELLDQRALAGEGTTAEAVESLRLCLAGVLRRPAPARPRCPTSRSRSPCYSGTFEDITGLLADGGLPGRAATYDGPVEVVYGLGSPVPPDSSIATAHAFPQGSATGVPDAGHFLWLEQPGSVADALVRLAARL